MSEPEDREGGWQKLADLVAALLAKLRRVDDDVPKPEDRENPDGR